MTDQSLWIDGSPVPVASDQTVAGALWQAGIRSWRRTRHRGDPRGLFCGIGACYDCLVTIDGVSSQRACLTPARAGMVVTTEPAQRRAGAPRAGEPAGSAPARTGPPPARRAAMRYELAVVGAGPAGLAAAATAALAGVRVVLIDSAPRPGGQFWRHREGADGHGFRDWAVFQGLWSIVEERVEHLAAATVWFVEPGITLHTSAGVVRAGAVVLATGAYDRAVPFAGWDLPGVVTPGAAQALLKGSGVAIGRQVVVAGAGPFLLPVAVGLAEAGVRVVGVFESGGAQPYLRRLNAVAAAVGKLGEATSYASALARHRIPYRTRHAVIAAHGTGDSGVEAVEVARLDRDGHRVPGSGTRFDCDAVAVGYGFTANVDLALALGCATTVGPDGGLAVLVDQHGQTSVPGVYAAGEVTGIGGSSLAVTEGELAGASAARSLGTPSPLSGRELAALVRRRRRLRTFAEVMHAAHPVPAGWPAWLEPSTLVCRCEEVPVEEISAAVTELGATDARTVKLLARTGMGWCQGRICGYATAQLTARACERPVSPAELATFAQRPLAAPVTLAELADVSAVPSSAGPLSPTPPPATRSTD